MCYGNITTEHTIWCGACSYWVQEAVGNKARFTREMKEVGWKKINGKWTCPKCIAEGRKPQKD